jgi:sulfhydrogenase subunit beta (sulfur reductase)
MEKTLKISVEKLSQLFTALKSNGYMLIAPTLRDGAIVYDKVESAEELPIGWTDQQGPGLYKLQKETKGKYFGYHCTPQSWKRFLYPPRRTMFHAKKNGKTYEIWKSQDEQIKYAFIGVRPCELNAINIQDLVFASEKYGDEDYKLRRKGLFVVTVNCTEAGENCFCSSMATGPKARGNYDIALTEVAGKGEHYFLMEAGTEIGETIANQTDFQEATEQEVNEAIKLIRHAENKMKKFVDISNLPKILSSNLEHPRWDDITKKCLSCGNCTMVCPTCFCSTVEDLTDLTGNEAERVREWDSCFTMDFSKVSGGNFRISPKSRYRQWLTHKFSSWVDQFGVFGCVGCGRCITWCPVGIDITTELNIIRGEVNN